MQITKQNTNSSEMYKNNKNMKASALLLTQALTFLHPSLGVPRGIPLAS